MNTETQKKFWSNYFIENPKIFWICYIMLLFVLIIITFWFTWTDDQVFDLSGRGWFPLVLLAIYAIFLPLIYYFRKKEHQK